MSGFTCATLYYTIWLSRLFHIYGKNFLQSTPFLNITFLEIGNQTIRILNSTVRFKPLKPSYQSHFLVKSWARPTMGPLMKTEHPCPIQVVHSLRLHRKIKELTFNINKRIHCLICMHAKGK